MWAKDTSVHIITGRMRRRVISPGGKTMKAPENLQMGWEEKKACKAAKKKDANRRSAWEDCLLNATGCSWRIIFRLRIYGLIMKSH